MEDPQTIWDNRYSHSNKVSPNYDYWLEPWNSLFVAGTVVLDLGCGPGHDTKYLLSKGCTVVASDFSKTALSSVNQSIKQANFVQVDFRQGLPFTGKQFQVIVASLSLHYLPWEQTNSVIKQIRNCLVENGVFLARFNSINDTNHGGRGASVTGENYFAVNGVMKRFFDSQSLRTLFETGWKIDHLEEKVIHRYDKSKVIWEVVTVTED